MTMELPIGQGDLQATAVFVHSNRSQDASQSRQQSQFQVKVSSLSRNVLGPDEFLCDENSREQDRPRASGQGL